MGTVLSQLPVVMVSSSSPRKKELVCLQ